MISQKARKLLDALDQVWIAEEFDAKAHWAIVAALRKELKVTYQSSKFSKHNPMPEDERRERLIMHFYIDQRSHALKAPQRMRTGGRKRGERPTKKAMHKTSSDYAAVVPRQPAVKRG